MALTRPLAGVAAVAFVALGLVILLPDCASACSCAYVGAPGELTHSSAVFSGEVVDFDKRSAFNATAILRVSEVWKGPEQETLEVNTRDPAFCGYPFKEGQEYLVYAQGGQDRLMVKNCGRTRPLSKAGADLAVLGNGQRLGDDEFLPDTSGGVAGLGVVALATVAAATAGLFLLKRHLKTR